MKTIKLGAMFLVSMMALAGTGAAYSLWFEDLYILTDIHTGEVDVDWSMDGFFIDQAKDISTAEMDIVGNTLWIYIWDAYPCINYYFYFDIYCEGSIPVHFTPFDVFPDSDLPVGSYDYDVYVDWITRADGETDKGPWKIEDIQLHQGDEAFGTFRLHFNNEILENTYYIFDLHSMAHQYNELEWGP